MLTSPVQNFIYVRTLRSFKTFHSWIEHLPRCILSISFSVRVICTPYPAEPYVYRVIKKLTLRQHVDNIDAITAIDQSAEWQTGTPFVCLSRVPLRSGKRSSILNVDTAFLWQLRLRVACFKHLSLMFCNVLDFSITYYHWSKAVVLYFLVNIALTLWSVVRSVNSTMPSNPRRVNANKEGIKLSVNDLGRE